jgi:hypothetical protein
MQSKITKKESPEGSSTQKKDTIDIVCSVWNSKSDKQTERRLSLISLSLPEPRSETLMTEEF